MADFLKSGKDFITLYVLGLILFLVTLLFPSDILRTIFGVPFLLFCPGYAFIAALFVGSESLNNTARVALSVVLSVAISGLAGLVLSYTIWGLRLEPLLYSITLVVFLISLIGWVRRFRLPAKERFQLVIPLRMPRMGQGILGNLLASVLILAILGAAGVVVFTLTVPAEQESYTEFYILGEEGRAKDYPVDLQRGEPGNIVVGIINHEGNDVEYRIEIYLDNQELAGAGPAALADGEKWEEALSFLPVTAGESQRLEVRLFKGDDAEPYLTPLYLWVDVTE